MFLVKYDSSGSVIWANEGTGNSISRAISVVSDVHNNIYVTGIFAGSAFFGLSGSPTLTLGYTTLTVDSLSYSMYIAKFNERTLGVNNVIMSKCANVLIYPNPAQDAINLSFDNASSVSSISIFDLLGRKVLDHPVQNMAKQSVPISLPPLKDGVYFLRAISNTGMESMPFVIKN